MAGKVYGFAGQLQDAHKVLKEGADKIDANVATKAVVALASSSDGAVTVPMKWMPTTGVTGKTQADLIADCIEALKVSYEEKGHYRGANPTGSRH
jgi:hypothetical protein